SAVLIDTYAQKTALRLGVAPESVRAEFKKIPSTQSAAAERNDESFESAVQPESARLSPSELHLLKLLLLHDELVPQAALHLDLDWISNPAVREIVGHRLAAQRNGTWKNLAAFLDENESQENKNIVTEAATEERKIPNPETQLADVLSKLRNQFLDRQIAALTTNASRPEISDAQKIELLQQQQKLREQKRAPLSPLN
ncbi:MAG TPA: DNA primase, partial [Verrucomicrobiae bacterium]|nr:DNA primase [Verrucomicrobiae bacterium]